MNKKLVILGGGESGVGAALLAKQQGFDVFLSDAGKLKDKYRSALVDKAIPFEEGSHDEARILTADEVVKSPGIPEKAPLIKALRAQNTPIISEIEFASRYTKARFVGISGSNGKTTTTLLTHHILKRAGIKVGLAGNVGKSLASLIVEGDNYDWIVLELSSFQLDGMFDTKLDIAILTNITPDHLDRYEYDLMKYAKSKMRLTQNQDASCWFIYNQDDLITMEVMQLVHVNAQLVPISIEKQTTGISAYSRDKQIFINPINPLIMTIQELALQGKHNLYNSMAAGIAGRILEVRKETIRECLSDFQNIEHRLELVNTVYGIDFINDSKATNVNSTWYALESMTKKVVWIVGGVDKGNDYNQVVDMVSDKVKAIVCLGKDNSKLHEAFGGLGINMVDCDNMRDAVYAAYKMGEKGDAVLLSPACASFDLFQDYEDRGRQFKESVRNL